MNSGKGVEIDVDCAVCVCSCQIRGQCSTVLTMYPVMKSVVYFALTWSALVDSVCPLIA